MRTAGWVFFTLGALSLIGALLAGDKVLGPLFFLALGAWFINWPDNQDNHEPGHDRAPIPKYRTPFHVENADYSTLRAVEVIDLNSVQSQLSEDQREASICLIVLFASYCDIDKVGSTDSYIENAAEFFGIKDYASSLPQIQQKYPDSNCMIDIITSIRSNPAKTYILYTCHKLARLSGKYVAHELLRCIADEMGIERGIIYHQLYSPQYGNSRKR